MMHCNCHRRSNDVIGPSLAWDSRALPSASVGAPLLDGTESPHAALTAMQNSDDSHMDGPDHDTPRLPSGQLPSGIVIGLGRAGTTWMHRQLELEPSVYTPPQKDVWFFDRSFDRGTEWYAAHFVEADGRPAIDVSHDYFFHALAPGRIAATCPEARTLLVLRDPATWNLSIAKREAVTRHGRGMTARDVFNENLGTTACGLFSSYVRHWQAACGDRFRCLLYDDLQQDPAAFWNVMAQHLGFEVTRAPDTDIVNATSSPRFASGYRVAANFGQTLRRAGLGKQVGLLKRNPLVQRALTTRAPYRPDVLSEDEIAELRRFYRPDVEELGRLLEVDLVSRWGYDGSGSSGSAADASEAGRA